MAYRPFIDQVVENQFNQTMTAQPKPQAEDIPIWGPYLSELAKTVAYRVAEAAYDTPRDMESALRWPIEALSGAEGSQRVFGYAPFAERFGELAQAQDPTGRAMGEAASIPAMMIADPAEGVGLAVKAALPALGAMGMARFAKGADKAIDIGKTSRIFEGPKYFPVRASGAVDWREYQAVLDKIESLSMKPPTIEQFLKNKHGVDSVEELSRKYKNKSNKELQSIANSQYAEEVKKARDYNLFDNKNEEYLAARARKYELDEIKRKAENKLNWDVISSKLKWPGNDEVANVIERELAANNIKYDKKQAKSGSVYFGIETPEGYETIRIADHRGPIGGGFNVELQEQMGDPTYDFNPEVITPFEEQLGAIIERFR